MLQFGRFGWRSAQERFDMDGCAGPVMGEITCMATGNVFGFEGWRIGEMKGLENRLFSEVSPYFKRTNKNSSIVI